jgi:hypothetical protein
MVYKVSDAQNVKNHIEAAVRVALTEALQTPIHVRVLYSNVEHSELQPEGDIFNIQFRVEIHPKKEEQPAK